MTTINDNSSHLQEIGTSWEKKEKLTIFLSSTRGTDRKRGKGSDNSTSFIPFQ
jgi:hypothetical protein